MLVFQRQEHFGALASEGAQLIHDRLKHLRCPAPAGRSIGPLLPQATSGKVSRCALGPECGIEVKQCAESNALVVVEVMSWQVVIKISAQQIGVRTVAERGKGDAVGRAGIGPLAGKQKVTDAAAELSPASYKAACTNSLVNTSRSGPINRSELPPNRR